MFHVPHPRSAQWTSIGGSTSSQVTPSQDQSSCPALLMTQMLSQMQAQASASQYGLTVGGELGSSGQGGTQRAETSGGQRQSVSSFLSRCLSQGIQQGPPLRSLGTIKESLKGGKLGEVETAKSITSSSAFTKLLQMQNAKLSLGTSDQLTTQQMAPRGVSTPRLSSSSQKFSFLRKSSNTSPTYSLACGIDDPELSSQPSRFSTAKRIAISSEKDNETQPAKHQCTMTTQRYPADLTPLPSSLHPPCLTKERLTKWTPAMSRADLGGLPSDAQQRV